MDNITKIQDDNSDWYWIPSELIKDFMEDLEKIAGKEYMDCCHYFDYFEDKYNIYKTGGDIGLIPDIFI